LVNTREVASFIDDTIVKEEERYNEVVKEVIKRLVENDLYVKPEMCVWEVREIEFLGVMIEPERIKIKEEKMKVLETD